MMFLTAPQLANYREQTHKPQVSTSKTQCGPKCKKQRSIAQFWNKQRVPAYKFCGVCRKTQKLARELKKVGIL